MIDKEPFRAYSDEEEIEQRKKDKGEVVTVWLSPQDREWLNAQKQILQQEKDGTSIKQLAQLGAKLLGDEKIKETLYIILNNYRKNKRLGVVTFD